MNPALNFGDVRDDEAKAVEGVLKKAVICSSCGATLDTYSDRCFVPLDEPCLGFLTVEGARLHLRRRSA